VSNGGLGNQLFILAAAHYVGKIAPNRKIVIVHKKSFFSRNRQREFGLSAFRCECKQKIEYRESLLIPFVAKRLDEIKYRMPSLGKRLSNMFRYESVHSPQDFSVLRNPNGWVVTQGYFQDVKMVLEVEQVIKVELQEASN